MTSAPSALEVVGHSVPRLESRAKVTGQSRYTVDLELPRLLHARFARSLYPHARIVKVDATAAEALPGVVLVLSSANIEDYLPGLSAFSTLESRPPDTPAQPGDVRLFDSVVRFAGEPVALVVAETEALARQAVGLVEVVYEELLAVLDPEAAQAADAPLIHAAAAHNLAHTVTSRLGDIERGLAEAALVVQDRFVTPRQKHAQLEPTASVAQLDSDGRLTVWSAHQSPHRCRDQIASLFHLPQSRVRVVTPTVGGAFGKGDTLTVEPYAAAAALACRRPVKLELSRQEDFVGTDARHPTITHLTLGLRADGTICALKARSLIDAGAYLGHSAAIPVVLTRQLLAPYHIPHADIEARVVYTNTPGTGAFRGYGGPQACFPLEHLIDRGARALQVDPLEVRQRMRLRVGDDWRGLDTIHTDGFGECLERAATRIGWPQARQHDSPQTGRTRRGVGMACTVWASGSSGRAGVFDYSGAEIKINTDGTVTLLTGGCDLGTGLRTTLAQICAEQLGVPFEWVFVAPAATDTTPYDSGAHASRSLYRNGQAVQEAAALARQQILDFAATRLEVAIDDLDLRAGRVTVRGAPSSSMDLATVAREALRADRELRASAGTATSNAPTVVVQFAEIEVDVETGKISVLRLVTAQDVGRAINPQIVVGQIQGAAHQGLGYALSETLIVDRDTGTVLNASFMDYRVPTTMDAPASEVILVEYPAANGPFGARGAAEQGLIPTAAAIANAVLHATGASITELPLTPERVLAGLRKQSVASAQRVGEQTR